MLLHQEGVVVDVEGELLAVQRHDHRPAPASCSHVLRDPVRDLLAGPIRDEYCGQVSTNHSSPEGVHVVVPEVVVGVVQAGDHQPAARHLGLDLKENIRTSLHNRKSHYLTWASATSAMGARAVLMWSMGMQSTYFTGFRPPPT